MYSVKKTETDMSGLWHLAIVIQGIIVAFTVFLGRVYVLTYYEVLGVPLYEAQFNTIDYAIVSPGITVLGIGFSIIVGSYFLLSEPISRLQLPVRYNFSIGLLLPAVGLVTLIISSNVGFDSVIRSLLIVLSLIMNLFGGAMLGLALSAKTKRVDLRSEQKLAEVKSSYKLLYGVTAVGIVVAFGTFAYFFSHLIASEEASDALQQSPRATVQFESGHSGNFGVIMIDEKFMYLLPEESEALQAFPHSSIVKVDYGGQ